MLREQLSAMLEGAVAGLIDGQWGDGAALRLLPREAGTGGMAPGEFTHFKPGRPSQGVMASCNGPGDLVRFGRPSET